MDTLDQNFNTNSLSTNFKESYIKKPFQVWKISFILFLVFGVLGTIFLIYSEFGLDNSFYYIYDYGTPEYNDAQISYRSTYDSIISIVTITYIIGYIALILAIIFSMILLYRNWNVIQGVSNVRTTPGSAVGLLFVPFYNLYWLFVAHKGLSEEQERFLSEAGITPTVPPKKGLALAYCICMLIPYIGQLATVLVLGPLKEINQKDVSLSIIREVGK